MGPSNPRINEVLKREGEVELKSGTTLKELLRRPKIKYEDIKYISELVEDFQLGVYPRDTEYQVEVQVKYAGYIQKSLRMIEKHKSLENKVMPADLNYDEIENITGEAREKLKEVRPMNIGQASRISGVSPADVQILMMILKARGL